MSEHEHEYKLEGGRRYYYCECGETGPGIEDLWKERIENHARIKALEGVVRATKSWTERNHSFMSNGEVVKCVCVMCISLSQLEEV